METLIPMMRTESKRTTPTSSTLTSIEFHRMIATSLECAMDELVSALRREGFSILSHLRFSIHNRETATGSERRVVILRAFYPASDTPEPVKDSILFIRCSAVLREKGPKKVSIELTKLGQGSKNCRQQSETLSEEVDTRLARILPQIGN